MAVNLNPGADATIAAAAGRAGAALAPADYGRAFRGYSDQYADAMETIRTARTTMIATVGLKVADIKKRWNTIQDNVGDEVSDTIFTDMKGLANERKDMALGFSGSYDGNGNWVRGEKFKKLDDVSRSQAKAKWRKKKKARFRTLRDIEGGRLLLGNAFSGKDIDKNALTASQLAQVEGIINGGEPITQGPAKGVRANIQLDEKGEYYEYRFYGPDGQEVSGFNEDGSPIYVGKNVATPASADEILEGSGAYSGRSLRRGSGSKIDLLRDISRTGATVEEGASTRDYKEDKIKRSLLDPLDRGTLWYLSENGNKVDMRLTQLMLDRMGYKGADGESLVVTGELDTNTAHAFEQFKKDQSAQQEVASNLWSDIYATGEGGVPSSPDRLSLSPSDIPGLFTTKDLKAQEDTNAIGLNSGLNQGLTTDLPFDEGQVRQDLDNVIDNSDNPDNTLRHLMHADVLGMDESFADHLTKPNEFTDEMFAEIERLAGLGLIQDTGGEPDEDGNPKYTAEDFKPSDVSNFKALRNAMLDTNNAQSREIFTNFLTNGVRDKFDQGRSTREAERARQSASNTSTTGSGGDRTYMTSQLPNGSARYVTWNQMGEQVDMFKDAEKRNDGQEFSGVDGEQYRFTEGQWEMLVYSEDGNEASFTPADRNVVLNNLHISDRAEWLKSVGEAPVIEGEATAQPPQGNTMPESFVAAVSSDENDVIAWFENNKDYPNVKAEEALGFDNVKITIGDKSKVFRVDPMFDSNKERAAEIWGWIQENNVDTSGQQGGFATKFNTPEMQEETSPANQDAAATPQDTAVAPVDTNVTSWRSNKDINAGSVDQFNIKGSVGTGKANIFKNNKPIEVKVAGGMATVTGVRAVGNSLIVDVDAPFGQGGEKTMGSFGKVDGKYVFKGNKEVYGELKGQDKKDFDAFVLAVETDPRFGDEILKSVSGTTDFNPKDYK